MNRVQNDSPCADTTTRDAERVRAPRGLRVKTGLRAGDAAAAPRDSVSGNSTGRRAYGAVEW